MSVTSNAPTLIPTSAGTPISFSELRAAFKETSIGSISARELLRDVDLNNDNPIVPDCTENSAIAAASNDGAVWTIIYGPDENVDSGHRVVFQNNVYTFWYEGVEVGNSPSGTWPPSDVNSFIGQINKRFSVGDLFVDNGNVKIYRIIVEEVGGIDWSIDILRNKIKYYYMTQSGTILNLDLDNPKNTSSGYADWNNNISKNIVKTLTLNGTLGSNEPRIPATTMDAEVRNMTIKVNGNIYGAGGEGGPYVDQYALTQLTGEDGGTALYVKSTATQPKTRTINVELNSSSEVYAGGGGGGRGGYGQSGGSGGGTVTWPGGIGGEGGTGGKGGTGRGYNNQSASIRGTNGIAGGTGGSGSTMTWKDAKDSTLNDSTGTYYKPQWANKIDSKYANPRIIHLRVKGSGWQSVWVLMAARGQSGDDHRDEWGAAYYKAVFEPSDTPTKDYGIRHRHYCNYTYEWSEGSMNDYPYRDGIYDYRYQFDLSSRGNPNHWNIKEPCYTRGRRFVQYRYRNRTLFNGDGYDGYYVFPPGGGAKPDPSYKYSESRGPWGANRMEAQNEGCRYKKAYLPLGWVYCGDENSTGYHDIKVSIWGCTYNDWETLITTGAYSDIDPDGAVREFGVPDRRTRKTQPRAKGRSLTKNDVFNPGNYGNDRNQNVRGQVAGYNWHTRTWSAGAGGDGGDGGRGGDGGDWGVSGDLGTNGLTGGVGYDSDTATYIRTNTNPTQQHVFNVATPYIGPDDDPRERSKNPKADQYGHEKLDVEFEMDSSLGNGSGSPLPTDIDLWIRLNGIIMSRHEWLNFSESGLDYQYGAGRIFNGVQKWNWGLDIPHRHQIDGKITGREGGSGSKRNPYFPAGVAGLTEPLTGFGTRYELYGAIQNQPRDEQGRAFLGPHLSPNKHTNITDHLQIQSNDKKIRLYQNKTGSSLSGDWIEITCNVGRFSKENNKFYWRTDANHWSWGVYGMTQNASTTDFNSSVPGNIIKDLEPDSYYGPIWAETKSKVSGPAKMVSISETHLYINDFRKRSDMGINGDSNICMSIVPRGAGFVTGVRKATPPSGEGAIGAGGGESGKAVEGDNYRVTGTLTDNTLKGDY